MTVTEFNTKYQDFLEKDHYGLDISDKLVIEYLDNIFTDLIKIPGFKYSQIKIKFNKVCLYSNLSPSLESSIEYRIEDILNTQK